LKFPELRRFPVFAYDTETTGLKWETGAKVFGFSISTPDGKDYYYDIREQPEAWEWWGDNVRKYGGIITCHNASFDYHFTRNSYVTIPKHLLDDTVIRACLINEHLFSYELDNLSNIYLGEGKFDIVPILQDLFGGRGTKNVQMRNLPDAPSEIVGTYAKTDTRRTLDLWNWQEKEIDRQGIRKIVKFERDLMPEILSNEEKGIRVNEDAAEKAVYGLTKQILPMQNKLNEMARREINVNSNPQMHALFEPVWNEDLDRWFSNDGSILPTTPGGKASLSADALRDMGGEVSELVINIRKMLKLRDTFLNGHVLGYAVNGRIHPRIHQTKGPEGGTGTGRFSYSEPALQQIPARDKKVSSIVRPVFLPDEGCNWVDSDKASFEVRVFTHLVNNPTLIAEYQSNPGLDLHAYVSQHMSLPRNKPPQGGPNAKQLNLSAIFNTGNGAIAEQLNMPFTWETFLPRGMEDKKENYITYKKAGYEAMRLIDEYHERIPGIKEFAETAKERALRRGYVFTMQGRRLRFPRGFKVYKASGLIIQATAADWNKQNWMIIGEELKNTGGRLLINTHDSYGLSLPIGEEEQLARKVKKGIEDFKRSRVPLILEVNKPGKDWWESYNSEVWIR